jgi:hypothetical protein
VQCGLPKLPAADPGRFLTFVPSLGQLGPSIESLPFVLSLAYQECLCHAGGGQQRTSPKH